MRKFSPGLVAALLLVVSLFSVAWAVGKQWVVDARAADGTSVFRVDTAGDATLKGRLVSVASLSVADNATSTTSGFNLAPTADIELITCLDSNSCTATLSETGALTGSFFTAINQNATTTIFSDTSGVSETTGTITLGAYDSISFVYSGDRWVETGTSNN